MKNYNNFMTKISTILLLNYFMQTAIVLGSCGMDDFSGSSLTETHMQQLMKGDFKEIDLSATDIKNKGLKILENNVALLSLDLADNYLETSDILDLSKFTNLEYLNLANNRLDDSSLNTISQLTKLKELDLQYNYITSKGIKEITKLENLQTINCGYMNLGNEGIEVLTKLPNLSYLAVRSTGFDEKILDKFSSMGMLTKLDISYNTINRMALKKFRNKNEKMEIVADYIDNDQENESDSKAQLAEELIDLSFAKMKLNHKNFTDAAPPSKYRNIEGNAPFETGFLLLMDLPDDPIKQVFSELDYHSLKSVSLVNKHFRNLAIKCGWGTVKKAKVNSVASLDEFLKASGFSPTTDITIVYDYPRRGIQKYALPKPLEITPQQLVLIWGLLPSLKRISWDNISLGTLGSTKHIENIPYAVLEAFNLSNNNLTLQGGNFLISQFPAFKKLTHLSIKHNNLKPLIQQLAESISSMHSLTHIKLASLELEGHEIKDILIPALKKLPDLRSINLDANNNNDAVAEGIADLIMNGRSSTLEEISLTHDILNYHGASLTSKGVKALQEAISSPNNNIVQLNLSGHIFDEQGEKIIRQLQRKPNLNLQYTKEIKF